MQRAPRQQARRKTHSNDFLTKAQRRVQTGWAHKKKQIEWLRTNKIKFTIDGKGWPQVTWDAVHGRRAEPTKEPNTNALRALTGAR